MTTTSTCPMPNQLSPGSQMDDLQLQQLVQKIQASPDRQDRVVRKQMNLLLTEVSARLQPAKKALIGKWSGIVDIESIVAEAINNTLLAAIKNIDCYEPDQAKFMTWINGILRFRFFDALNKCTSYQENYQPISFDELISEDNPNATVENKLQAEIVQRITETEDLERNDLRSELRQFIETDPDGILAKVHIRNKPEATFQEILLRRLVPMTWQAITDSFDIASHGTINTFHDRQLCIYKSYFRQYLQE